MSDIIAKVANLVSPNQVAFNAGSSKNVSVGDLVTFFRVVDVVDPDSKRSLGSVRVPRLRMRVNVVDAEFCVATVVDTRESSFLFTSFPSAAQTKVVSLDKSSLESDDDVVRIEIGEPVVIALQK